MTNISLAISAFACSLAATSATAADFKRIPQPNGRPDVIVMSGHIERDDDLEFIRLTSGREDVTVVLASLGGSTSAAIAIGVIVRERGYGTRVENGAMCSSACFLIWSAGKYRHLGKRALLGLHSAATRDGQRSESGNRAIARYLELMQMPQAVIELWPKADPCCINYVDSTRALAWGLLHERPGPQPPEKPLEFKKPSPPFIVSPVLKYDTLSQRFNGDGTLPSDPLSEYGRRRAIEIAE
jgi:hypothetical protein